jgi:outer membrane receptor protein involved in Fe transport
LATAVAIHLRVAPCWAVAFGAVLVAAAAGPAHAQEAGEITGAVVDSATAKPLPYATVAVVDTRYGANTQLDGTFRIRNVPVGTYTVRASYLGYDLQVRTLTVAAGGTSTLRFALRKRAAAGTTKKIVVLDTRPLVDVAEISTVRETRAEDIRKLTVDAIADVVSRQVGVSGDEQSLHVRGGRSDETLFRIESVAMKNVVTGAPVGAALSAKAVQEIRVITGGYEAEYGQAISGVVDVELKEPGRERQSDVEWQTGSFDTQRLFLQTAGREPITSSLLPKIGAHVPGSVGLLLGMDLLYTDSYLPSEPYLGGGRRSLLSGYRNSFLGVKFDFDDFLRMGQRNSANGYAKLTWRATPRHKVNLTFTKFIGLDHGFHRARSGEDARDGSTANPSYPWRFRDNMDQYSTFAEDTNAQVLNWKFAIDEQSYSSMSVSRFFNSLHESVRAKSFSDYEEWREVPIGEFFVQDSNGDFPFFQDQFVERWGAQAQYTRRWQGNHEFKAGVETNYYTLQMIEIRDPKDRPDGLGSVRDLYRVNPNDGAFYAQNRFKYEGFVGHAGLRADYLFLGEQADDAVAQRRNDITESVARDYLDHTHSLFGRRYKVFLSPRLGINHPVTDRDEMHFNFGHFIQWPQLTRYFAKIGSRSSEAFPLVGNLDLDPERSVQYEAGVKHQFTDHDALDVTFYNKDVYDYPVSQPPIEATLRRLVYVNSDFSRTRGLEIVFRHRGPKRLSGSISYEYQIATGKPADPNRIRLVDPDALETGDAEPELTEQFMTFNRPHRVQINLDWRFGKGDRLKLGRLTLPDRWGANVFWSLRSGRAYTPTNTFSEPTGKKNSKNTPFESIVDLKLERNWDLLESKRFAVTFEARNLFDTRILRTVDSSTGERPRLGVGHYVDANLPRDPVQRAALERELSQSFQNPAFYAEGRNLRLGMEVSF